MLWRRAALSVVLAAALAVFVRAVHAAYPLEFWLVWRYAGYWLACLAWAAACLAAGTALTARLLPGRARTGERLLAASAAGVYVFFLGTFLAGIAGWFGTAFFLAWPALLLGGFARPAWRVLGPRIRRHVRAVAHSRPRPLAVRVWRAVLVALGITAAAVVYIGILVPHQIGFDARWYHLAIAEHYVADGGISAFREGWYIGAYPHLSSVLYAWAFMVPGGALFDQVALALHLEYTLFLATLAGIAVLARALIARPRLRHAWVALFLFPALFVFDSALIAGADHVAAFWAPVLALLALRAWRTHRTGVWLLLAVAVAGALLTKYSAVLIVAFPALALALRVLWRALRPGDRGRWLAAAGVACECN